MKFTERFFEFPVRIYDRFTSEQAEEKEKNVGAPIEGKWREGKIKLAHNDIASWSDFFDSEQGPEGVDEDGFLYTIILTHSKEYFICIWPKDEFEANLDEYAEKYENWAEGEIRKSLGGENPSVN